PTRVSTYDGQATRELPRHGYRAGAHLHGIPAPLEPHVHVNAAVARRLGPARESQLAQQGPHLARGDACFFEADAGLRVEIDAELVRVLRVRGQVRPDVEAEAPEVHGPREVGEVGRHERP